MADIDPNPVNPEVGDIGATARGQGSLAGTKKGKRFFIKIYDRQGNRVSTQSSVSIGSFEWSLNGGLGALTIRLPKRIDDFGESSQINFLYGVKIYVYDNDSGPLGRLLYYGYITSYNQIVHGSEEYVDVNLLGYQTLLSRIMLKDGENTTVSYSAEEIAFIVKDLLEKADSFITTTHTSVENTGEEVSYTFRNNTVKEALDKAIDLSPDGFYWITDATNTLTFANVDFSRTDFFLNYRRDFTDLEVEKSMEEMTNSLYFIGGGDPNLYRKYSRTSSISDIGLLESTKTDERVTLSDTADRIGEIFLNKMDHPKITIKMRISDTNLRRATGKDIESMRPGMVVVIKNLTDARYSYWDEMEWDVDFWDFDFLGSLGNPMVIKKITYEGDAASLELGDFTSTFLRQYTAFEDKVNSLQYQNLPTNPT